LRPSRRDPHQRGGGIRLAGSPRSSKTDNAARPQPRPPPGHCDRAPGRATAASARRGRESPPGRTPRAPSPGVRTGPDVVEASACPRRRSPCATMRSQLLTLRGQPAHDPAQWPRHCRAARSLPRQQLDHRSNIEPSRLVTGAVGADSRATDGSPCERWTRGSCRGGFLTPLDAVQHPGRVLDRPWASLSSASVPDANACGAANTPATSRSPR